MFYVAPLFLIALLAWVERGAPRPTVVSVAAAAACALVLLAIPFDRFLTTSAISDTLMLLPLWSLQDRIGEEWIATAAPHTGHPPRCRFLFVPRRFALVLPFLVLGLWAVSLRPIWWGAHGFERFSEGVLFQGIRAPKRDWVDRALPGRRHRCLPLDGSHGPVDREPERVLQPRCRARVLRRRSDAGNAPGDPGHDRPSHRSRHAPRRRARPRTSTSSPTPPSSLPARRSRSTSAGASASGGWAPPARIGHAGRRPLPDRHVVGRERHVRAQAVRAGRLVVDLSSDGALFVEPQVSSRVRGEGDRPGPLTGGRACCAQVPLAPPPAATSAGSSSPSPRPRSPRRSPTVRATTTASSAPTSQPLQYVSSAAR